jgi:hypothetical protein
MSSQNLALVDTAKSYLADQITTVTENSGIKFLASIVEFSATDVGIFSNTFRNYSMYGFTKKNNKKCLRRKFDSK